MVEHHLHRSHRSLDDKTRETSDTKTDEGKMEPSINIDTFLKLLKEFKDTEASRKEALTKAMSDLELLSNIHSKQFIVTIEEFDTLLTDHRILFDAFGGIFSFDPNLPTKKVLEIVEAKPLETLDRFHERKWSIEYQRVMEKLDKEGDELPTFSRPKLKSLINTFYKSFQYLSDVATEAEGCFSTSKLNEQKRKFQEAEKRKK